MKQLRTTVLPGVQILPQICEKRGFRLGVQIMLVVIFSALAAAGKVIHPSQGIPGSSSLYWLAPMMLGMTVMRWPGAGVLTGISMGCWGIPFGMEHTFGYNVALYGSTGLLIDLITSIPKVNIRHPLGAIVTGFGAHMIKFGFILGAATMSSVTRHFIVVGILNSALLHAAFGIASGFIAWSVFKLGQGASNKLLK
jgi:hypothetical protein